MPSLRCPIHRHCSRRCQIASLAPASASCSREMYPARLIRRQGAPSAHAAGGLKLGANRKSHCCARYAPTTGPLAISLDPTNGQELTAPTPFLLRFRSSFRRSGASEVRSCDTSTACAAVPYSLWAERGRLHQVQAGGRQENPSQGERRTKQQRGRDRSRSPKRLVPHSAKGACGFDRRAGCLHRGGRSQQAMTCCDTTHLPEARPTGSQSTSYRVISSLVKS